MSVEVVELIVIIVIVIMNYNICYWCHRRTVTFHLFTFPITVSIVTWNCIVLLIRLKKILHSGCVQSSRCVRLYLLCSVKWTLHLWSMTS